MIRGRGILDFIVWMIVRLDYLEFLTSPFGRFLAKLAAIDMSIYVTAALEVLRKRAPGTSTPSCLRSGHAIRVASARVYTGTDVIKPTKDNYEISKEYLPEPGSKWSHYATGLKRIGSKKVCDWLWKRIVINPDGSVSPCCSYYPQEYDFGNVSHKSIKSTWNSNKYIVARKMARNFNARFKLQEKIPCAICIPLGNFVDV